mmetsp:Transcript_10111/g.21189  ORF Transcript_10111/g.21189 Transcript_10111/m.21189 type:complete len:463 (-) Transcript_10111:1500-2888(-)
MQTAEEEDVRRQYHMNHWNETWVAFNLALRSNDDFNAFRWIFRLFKSGICFSYFQSGLNKSKVHIYWRSWVPALAIALIVVVIVSYFRTLREIVKERWCCDVFGTETKTGNSWCRSTEKSGGCRWLLFHDIIVAYLGIMINFNFLSACFRSPGVVLAKDQQQKDDGKGRTLSPQIGNEGPKECLKWSSKDSRGGFCGIDPILNIAYEAFLVQNYYNVADISDGFRNGNKNAYGNSKQIKHFPRSEDTFCNKCQIQRPPRCHHCSICDRCVLQFDHHCVWLNNCVGYNNHRAFILTLLYLTIGCWYGCVMLYRPFFEELGESSGDHASNFFDKIENAVFDLPSVSTIFSCISSGCHEKEMIIKLVFPFLTAVGFLQTIFLGYHLIYIFSALTTLEHKILLDLQFKQVVGNSSSSFEFPSNPFSRGWLRNLSNAVGPIYLVLLPLQVDPKETSPALKPKTHKGQ